MESPYGSLGDAETYLARAELLFDLDRFDDAREELGGALSADPAHVPSLTLLAILELQVGKHDDALTAASAALAAEPTHDTARLARGHALALLHRTGEALDTAAEIQERHPESWWHNVHYALIVRESRNGQDALDAAWVAVRLAPEDARAHLALARVAVDLGLTDLAERALSAAERLDPGVSSILEGDLGPRLLRGSPANARRTHTGPKDELHSRPPKPERPALPDPVRGLLRLAGFIGIIVPTLAAWISGGQQDTARIVAGLGAAGGLVALFMAFQRLPVHLREQIRVMIDTDKSLGLAVALAACGPLLSAAYAATGMLFLLVIALGAGFGALIVTYFRTRLQRVALRQELVGRVRQRVGLGLRPALNVTVQSGVDLLGLVGEVLRGLLQVGVRDVLGLAAKLLGVLLQGLLVPADVADDLRHRLPHGGAVDRALDQTAAGEYRHGQRSGRAQGHNTAGHRFHGRLLQSRIAESQG